MYKIGICGFGYVGKGMDRMFHDDVVAIYDPYITDDVRNDKQLFKYVDLAIVCVPTPTAKDGISCDTSIVEETIKWLNDLKFSGVILIKSTVAPTALKVITETYSHLRITFSPEFLGESKYYTPFWKYPDPMDMRTHMWQTFGGNKKDTSFCVDVFKRKMSVDTVFIQTDILTAALAKYIENSFFAMKVTFCNEWFDIAKSYGVDWNTLRECWLADPRINKNHTLVFPLDRGYGGKCFPKDVKGIIQDSRTMGYEPELMAAVDKVNTKIRNGKP